MLRQTVGTILAGACLLHATSTGPAEDTKPMNFSTPQKAGFLSRARTVRWRWLLLGLGLLVLLGAAVTLFSGWGGSGVTRENFESIRIGMSKQQVEGILGGPPGDYRVSWGERWGYDRATDGFGKAPKENERQTEGFWIGSECALVVFFDEKAVVIGLEAPPLYLFQPPPPEPPILDRLRRQLPW